MREGEKIEKGERGQFCLLNVHMIVGTPAKTNDLGKVGGEEARKTSSNRRRRGEKNAKVTITLSEIWKKKSRDKKRAQGTRCRNQLKREELKKPAGRGDLITRPPSISIETIIEPKIAGKED